MPVTCFLIEQTDRVQLSLRRYRQGTRWDAEIGASVTTENGRCPLPHGYHNAATVIGEAPVLYQVHEDGHKTYARRPEEDAIGRDDPRWPATCACGEPFNADDAWQVFSDHIYRRVDNGEERQLRDWQKVPGAMWDAWYYHDWARMCGFDGRSMCVVCPDGHEWCIDGVASNCPIPEDRGHKCWLRTGEPPNLTVGKNVEGQRTCSAGGGSIATPGYHGFMTSGVFT